MENVSRVLPMVITVQFADIQGKKTWKHNVCGFVNRITVNIRICTECKFKTKLHDFMFDV